MPQRSTLLSDPCDAASAEPIALPLPVGSILAGKYRLDAVIASGGMGVVAAGEHVALSQRVAIKFLRGSATAETIARFTREAKVCARLRSDHIARVLDIDALPDGMPFMVMELLLGADLAVVLEAQGRMPSATAVDYVLQACEGLAEAHRQGIVHRDLKPANLFLTHGPDAAPLIKVLDFGISKLRSFPADTSPSDDLTKTNSLMGSPRYMSPEQLRNARDVDARADVWGLGVVLYKLISGRNAFAGESTPDLCIQILTSPVPPITEVVLPEGLFAVLRWCLEKEVERRCPGVAELAVALRPFGTASAHASVDRVVQTLEANLPPTITVPVYASAADVATDAPSVRPSIRERGWQRRRIVAVGLTLLASTAVIAVVGFGARYSRDAAHVSAAPAAPQAPAASSLFASPTPPQAIVPASATAPASASTAAPRVLPVATHATAKAILPAASGRKPPAALSSEPTDEFGSFGPRK